MRGIDAPRHRKPNSRPLPVTWPHWPSDRDDRPSCATQGLPDLLPGSPMRQAKYGIRIELAVVAETRLQGGHLGTAHGLAARGKRLFEGYRLAAGNVHAAARWRARPGPNHPNATSGRPSAATWSAPRLPAAPGRAIPALARLCPCPAPPRSWPPGGMGRLAGAHRICYPRGKRSVRCNIPGPRALGPRGQTVP